MTGIGIITNPMFIVLWALVLLKELQIIKIDLIGISIFSIVFLIILFLLSWMG